MPQQNQIAVEIAGDELQKIKGFITGLQTALAPHVISLSDQERHDILKIGDKSVAFVDKSMDYTVSNPEFVPKNLDVQAMQIDVMAINQLYPLLKQLTQITTNLSDTVMLSGSEAFKGALLYYGGVQMGMKTNEPNAKAIYEDLSQRYPGRSPAQASASKEKTE
jgi:hypothetical protein